MKKTHTLNHLPERGRSQSGGPARAVPVALRPRPDTYGPWLELVIAPNGKAVLGVYDDSVGHTALALSSVARLPVAVVATLQAGSVLPPGHARRDGRRVQDMWLPVNLILLPENTAFWRGRGAPQKHQDEDVRTQIKQEQDRKNRPKRNEQNYFKRMQDDFEKERQQLRAAGRETSHTLHNAKTTIAAALSGPHAGKLQLQAVALFRRWADTEITCAPTEKGKTSK